jgi:hypothetical protein
MESKFDVDLVHCDWPQFHWRASLRRVPAILILLLAGIFSAQTDAFVLATAAALSVGLGAGRQLRGSRLLAMLGTTLLMAFSAWIGTLAGNVYPVSITVVALWAFACGLFNVLSEDFGWMMIQAVIALLVAAAYPSHGLAAGGRALLILAGGGTQLCFISAFWYFEGIGRFGDEFKPARVPPGNLPPLSADWKSFRAALLFSSNAFHYALRVAVTIAIAVELDHLLQLKNGYWLPMTTLVVLKPDFYRTYANGVQRVIGTLTGVVAATAIAHLMQPQHFVLVALIGVFGFFAYAFLKTNAVIFSAAVTSFAVFLIALTGLPEATVTWHRLINTALGCGVALLARFVTLKLLRPLMPHPETKAVAANIQSK